MTWLPDVTAIAGCVAIGGFEMLGYGLNNAKEFLVKSKNSACKDSLGDKVCIITGGNAGIGFATASLFAERGATVVLACRDVRKANEAAEELRSIKPAENCPPPKVEVMQVDLSSLDSVRSFCRSFNESKRPLDVLICNAGLMAPLKRLETADGLEMQFQVNHLSHWLMAHELVAAQRQQRRERHEREGGSIEQLPATRVIICTSSMHIGCCNGATPDWNSEQGYIPLKAYAYSKLANILSAKEFQRRFDRRPEFGCDTAVAVHPGVVKTGLSSSFFASHASLFFPAPIKPWIERGVTAVLSPFYMSLHEAAEGLLYAALAPNQEVAGRYLHSSHVAKPHKVAEDEAVASDVWSLSCKLANVVTDLSLA